MMRLPRWLSGKESTCQMWVWSLGQEDTPERGMATHSSILAWRIPWTEEPGGLQFMGSQRVKYDWACMHLHDKYIQANLGGIVGSVPDHCNKVSILSLKTFFFLLSIYKIMFILLSLVYNSTISKNKHTLKIVWFKQMLTIICAFNEL